MRRLYPFNAEQTVNILSEFGPLVMMFVVNAMFGIAAGTWALIISTVVAIVVMRLVLQRLPVFPLIASSVTVAFGGLTLITEDAMWVQIKVTIFNAMFAGFLFGGLWRFTNVPRLLSSMARSMFSRVRAGADLGLMGRLGRLLNAIFPILALLAVGWTFGSELGSLALLASVGLLVVFTKRRPDDIALVALAVTMAFGTFYIFSQSPVWLNVNEIALGAMLAGFLLGVLFLNRNFFEYTFEKTFHYTQEGWDRFTSSFALFFIFTAVLNEIVRLSFHDTAVYNIFGYELDGVNIWILFKVAFIMPLSGLYAWFLTRLMHKYRIPDGADTPAPIPVPASYGRPGFERAAPPSGATGHLAHK